MAVFCGVFYYLAEKNYLSEEQQGTARSQIPMVTGGSNPNPGIKRKRGSRDDDAAPRANICGYTQRSG